MRRATLLLLPVCALGLACTAPPPSAAPAETSPAAEPAPEPAETPAAGDDAGAGFADPKSVDGAADSATPDAPAKTPADPALETRIKQKFGEACRLERTCGDLLGVDCKAAVDGPYYYAQRDDLKTIATCGGACMSGRCVDCPPKAWTCPTY